MVNHVAAQTMLMVVITSVVFGALGFILAPLLLRLLGVAPEVYAGALGFLRVSFVGILFVVMYAMFQALMRGVGQTRVAVATLVGQNIGAGKIERAERITWLGTLASFAILTLIGGLPGWGRHGSRAFSSRTKRP